MNCIYCGKPIDEHEKGRETDACVAMAMGWTWDPPFAVIVPPRDYEYFNGMSWKIERHANMGGTLKGMPHYSGDRRSGRKVENWIAEHGGQKKMQLPILSCRAALLLAAVREEE